MSRIYLKGPKATSHSHIFTQFLSKNTTKIKQTFSFSDESRGWDFSSIEYFALLLCHVIFYLVNSFCADPAEGHSLPKKGPELSLFKSADFCFENSESFERQLTQPLFVFTDFWRFLRRVWRFSWRQSWKCRVIRRTGSVHKIQFGAFLKILWRIMWKMYVSKKFITKLKCFQDQLDRKKEKTWKNGKNVEVFLSRVWQTLQNSKF